MGTHKNAKTHTLTISIVTSFAAPGNAGLSVSLIHSPSLSHIHAGNPLLILCPTMVKKTSRLVICLLLSILSPSCPPDILLSYPVPLSSFMSLLPLYGLSASPSTGELIEVDSRGKSSLLFAACWWLNGSKCYKFEFCVFSHSRQQKVYYDCCTVCWYQKLHVCVSS